ncbi:MAG: protein phosphatase CheZ [Nitrospiraceae bacterium]|nr:protein phosphatase CheZ [Nitrospiraceae bacterium]
MNGNSKLYGELGELARYLESAMRKVSEIGAPMVAGSAQLPQATAHLLDLNKMTEAGTMEVMRLAEIIQDNRARAAKELAAVISTLEAVDCTTLTARLGKTAHELAQDDKHLMDIMTALSFQDLVAQRVKKLVTIIEDVQCKLVELVVVFGLKEESATPETQGKAGEMLRQLEASKSTSIKQDLADELLSEFGFK